MREEVDRLFSDFRKMRSRLDEMDVEMESFVAKVSLAAKRAYKREADDARREARSDVANSPELTRAAQKAALRARLQHRGE